MRTLTTLLALPVAAALTMGLSSCSLFSSGTTIATKDLEVGKCYNTVSDKAGGDHPVGEVTAFPKDVDKLPSADSIKSLGQGFCQGEDFTKYVGVDAGSSSYQIEYLSPSDDTWATGDRKISCVVTQGDKSQVKGSAKNSKK